MQNAPRRKPAVNVPPRGWIDLVRQLAIWFGFLLAYQLARGAAEGSPGRAFANGLRVIHFEREHTHEILELGIQHLASSSRVLSDLAAWTYWNSEFTVVGLALLWVYLRRHDAFARFRNTILLANVIGLVGYFLVPTAPPRFFPSYGFVDSLAHFGGLNRGSGLLQLATDPYAAMPSLHAADALIVGVTLASLVGRRPLKVLWLLWPAWVWFCVIATGNHFWLDVIAGIAVAALALGATQAAPRLLPSWGTLLLDLRRRLSADDSRLVRPLKRAHTAVQAQPGQSRIVIVTAAVGEGHAAAARALAAALAREAPEAEVVICDALEGLGRFLRLIVCDAYRWQLRVAPWLFGVVYALFGRCAPALGLGRIGLAAIGGRSLLRLVEGHRPTVVVSTFPAATSVLGHLRQRGRLAIPVYATITDLAGVAFWAHRGIDQHLVMHESCVAGVERIAGRGSARRVQPLVAPEFFEPRSRQQARKALELPAHTKLVVVSGGGWAVGDLTGAVRATLAIAGTSVVALAGRDAEVRRQLDHEFADEGRVRVFGFTDRMSDLLAAADALVHSTGGVTCLEALVRGCPTIAYGAPPGHASLNARLMSSLGLVEAAGSRPELQAAIVRALSGRATPTALAHAPTAASLVAAATPRQTAKPARPRRFVRLTLAAAVLASAGALAVSTDVAYAFVARVFDLAPRTTVASFHQQIALVVRAPVTAVPAVSATLTRAHGHASFAISGNLEATTLATLARADDRPLPDLRPAEFGDWFETKKALREQARAYKLSGRFVYLAPAEGFTVGAYLLASDLGAQPISGAVELGPTSVPRAASYRAGDIVVVTLPQDTINAVQLIQQVIRALAQSHLQIAALPAPTTATRARR